jgi:hypothetical protein
MPVAPSSPFSAVSGVTVNLRNSTVMLLAPVLFWTMKNTRSSGSSSSTVWMAPPTGWLAVVLALM